QSPGKARAAVKAYRWWRVGPLLVALSSDCRPKSADPQPSPGRPTEVAPEVSAAIAPADAPLPVVPPSHKKPRILRFAWRPPRRSANAYEMSDAADQHQVVLTEGVTPGGRYPILIALHGQPKRGESPRSYAFPKRVAEVVADLVHRGAVR